MELNPSQLRAASFGSGPCLVLAGPGSGKTTVIIRRLKNLISKYHIRPEHILAVTFSRAAAGEMSERFAGSEGVTFGTVHSIFLKILKEDSGGNISVISPSESNAFIIHELKRYSVPYKSADDMCSRILLAISRMKSGGRPASPGSLLPEGILMKIFTDYSLFLKERSFLDFDDLVSECIRLFRQKPSVLAKWQDRYRFLCIDEFQDLSLLQYRALMMLAGARANVFAVGDDDQSIYGFRGAGAGIMQRFISDFPDAERIVLDVNYRCPSMILEASLSVIRENAGRFDKRLVPYKNDQGVLELSPFTSRVEEYGSIIAKLRELSSGGKSCAVLFRGSFDYSLFVLMMKKENMRFKCRDVDLSFHKRFPVREVISYLRSAICLDARSSASCREDLLRIINRPERYINRESMMSAVSGSAAECFDSMRAFYRRDKQMSAAIAGLENDLQTISSLSPYAAIRYVRKALRFDSWLLAFSKDKGMDEDELLESLDLLETFARGFDSLDELLKALDEGHDLPDFYENGSGLISVMTMHASKGMEFDVVFLPDVNEGIIPCKSAVRDGTIDEERRLLYVAMTRARVALHISWVREYRHKPAEVSRLIRHIL